MRAAGLALRACPPARRLLKLGLPPRHAALTQQSHGPFAPPAFTQHRLSPRRRHKREKPGTINIRVVGGGTRQ